MWTADGKRSSGLFAARRPADNTEIPILSDVRLEMLEVGYTGLDEQLYQTLRDTGISHSDVMEAHALGADLHAYGFLRAGYDHNSAVVEAGATGTTQHEDAVRLGVSADDLGELRMSYRANVTEYWRKVASTDAGTTDRPAPPMTSEYLAARRAGLQHPASLDFAFRLAAFTSRRQGLRMASKDVELWAKCCVAGLRADLVAADRPLLDTGQLLALHSMLFLLVSYDELGDIDHEELLWLAARSQTINTQSYIAARRRGWPRRLAVRLAA